MQTLSQRLDWELNSRSPPREAHTLLIRPLCLVCIKEQMSEWVQIHPAAHTITRHIPRRIDISQTLIYISRLGPIPGHTHTHTGKNIRTHTDTYTYIQTHIQTHAHIHTDTHIYRYIDTHNNNNNKTFA